MNTMRIVREINLSRFLKGMLGAAFVLVAGMTIPSTALAHSITVDSVVQRWPWNNKLDITYTVSGGQDRAAGVYARLVFSANIGGTPYTINGNDVGASADEGTHTVVWQPPSGIKAKGCTMTATLLSADIPSGNDYMIIDLETGAVSYEGLFSAQDASNARYNSDVYKTDKLVLRKVPAGGPYPTGDDVNYAWNNARKDWTTDRDYYIGVFPVTQSQYTKIYGSNPSDQKTSVTGNLSALRPVESVSWDDLRLASTEPTSAIPAVAYNTGTFFQRLNYKTGLYFDLPTEVMFEIAERAGATSTYFWGDTMDTAYVICSGNSGNRTFAVGSRLPNAWGLYDMAGNVWEWCLDDNALGNVADAVDPFTPSWTSSSGRRDRGGGTWSHASSGVQFRASYRDYYSSSSRANKLGFRVAYVVK